MRTQFRDVDFENICCVRTYSAITGHHATRQPASASGLQIRAACLDATGTCSIWDNPDNDERPFSFISSNLARSGLQDDSLRQPSDFSRLPNMTTDGQIYRESSHHSLRNGFYCLEEVLKALRGHFAHPKSSPSHGLSCPQSARLPAYLSHRKQH